MQRGLLALVSIALIAAGVYLWRRSRGETSTAPASSDASTAVVGRPSPTLPSGSDGTESAVADPRERPRAVADAPPPVNPLEIQTRMTDAHAHLQDAVKPCVPLMTKTIGAHDQFRFAYTLTYRNGEARVSNVEVVWSDLRDPKCLLEKLAAATWTVTDPDWTTTAEDALVGPELD